MPNKSLRPQRQQNPPNIHKREKCPKFRLSRPRTYKPSSRIQKSQIRAILPQKRQISRQPNPASTPRTLSQAKKHPKIPPKNKERHLNDAPITRPPPGRRANMYKPKPSAKIPINTTPRTKNPQKRPENPCPQKSTTKKFQKNIPKKVGNSLKIKNLQNLRFLVACVCSPKPGTPLYVPRLHFPDFPNLPEKALFKPCNRFSRLL